MLLLALFYGLIDCLGFRRWAWIWIAIGANAITIYFLQHIVSFGSISEYFLGGLANLSDNYRPLILAFGAITFKCLLLALMYNKKIFLRL